jgi:protein-disulfide isomerase
MKLFAVALTALMTLGAASLDVDKAKALGNTSAPVRLELFSDFQCPGCKAFHEQVLPILMKDYIGLGKVYFIAREFPLPMHPHSREAAYEATAAAHVGKYAQVADALFLNQAIWGASGAVWDTVSKVLTPAEQKKVLPLAKDPSIQAEVQNDVNTGQMLKVPETPTIFVIKGDKRYMFRGPNRDNLMLLRSLIDGLLK